MKLGSLFDGIGGFPHSAQRHGITPVWASEVEPSCVSITKRHFPDMKHLGDITKINGAEIELVDIITFGSPCQDLSVAGKRAGLEGARSGLFGEAIRIIDEMREVTNAEHPRFAIWENVPGALSSSHGLDFKAVLQSFAGCEIPMPDSGRWANAGMVRGGRCDIAWRVLDAQYWGVPQRRRRIFLVADFRGERASEILFKPESLRGDFAQSGTQGQEIAGRVGNGVKDAVIPINTQIATRHKQLGERTGLGIGNDGDAAFTLQAAHSHAIFDCRGNGDGKTSCTLTGDHQNRVTDYTAIICVSDTQRDAKICVDLAPTLTCMHEQPYIVDPIVRRLTPVECERLQGFPEIAELETDIMTKDEYIAFNLANDNIIVDHATGKIYATRGPYGRRLEIPIELSGTTLPTGYKVISVRNGAIKRQCRAHRIVWISAHGIIPSGYCIDHINNDKIDNRLCNLQLLTYAENSTKAAKDGCYLSGDDSPMTKVSPTKHVEIVELYRTGDWTMRQLAKRYRISKSRVHQIMHMKDWTAYGHDDKPISDTKRYAAIGNSVAIPCVDYIMSGIIDVTPTTGK